MSPPVRFPVARLCEAGCCSYSEGPCACPAPDVDVDVDELTPEELGAFLARGTAEQQGEILDWLAVECSPAELLAGQRDA